MTSSPSSSSLQKNKFLPGDLLTLNRRHFLGGFRFGEPDDKACTVGSHGTAARILNSDEGKALFVVLGTGLNKSDKTDEDLRYYQLLFTKTGGLIHQAWLEDRFVKVEV